MLSVQQRALAYAALWGDTHAPNKYVKKNGVKALERVIKEEHLAHLVEAHKIAPYEILKKVADTITNLERTDKGRVNRYLNAAYQLQVFLDMQAYPQREIREGKQFYIPHNFIDLETSKETNPSLREQDQLLLNKNYFHKKYHDTITHILSKERSQLEQALHVAVHVYNNPTSKESPTGKIKAVINEIGQASNPASRSHALITQAALQTLGIKSILYKNEFQNNTSTSSHTANIIKVDNTLHLLDVSNPDVRAKKPYILEIKDTIPTQITDTRRARTYTQSPNKWYHLQK